MTPSAKMEQTGTATPADGRMSPDWMHKNGGNIERRYKQTVPGENFVELKYRSLENLGTAKMAKALGLFSIALGLTEVLAPARLGTAIGVNNRLTGFLPLLGAREIAHGIGILAGTKPTAAVWTRVGGDVLDLAYLGAAFAAERSNKRRLSVATVAVLGVGLLDLICAQKLSARQWSEEDANPLAPTTVGQPSARNSAAMGASVTG